MIFLGVCDCAEVEVNGTNFNFPSEAGVFSKDETIIGGRGGGEISILLEDDDDDPAEIKWSQVSTIYCVALQTGEGPTIHSRR